MRFISEEEAVSLILREICHIGQCAKPESSDSASEFWSVRPKTSSPLSICNTNEHLVVSGKSTFANETRQIVYYDEKIYWIWHSSINSSEVFSIDSELAVSVELYTKNLVLAKLFFSPSGEPLFIARKDLSSVGRQNYIILCNPDFSIRWKYNVGKERVYKVLFLPSWNSVICVTQDNTNGYLYKTIYRIALSGEVVWKKQLPLGVSGGELNVFFSGENLEVWFGDQSIILSSSCELQQVSTYNIEFNKIVSSERTIYALASNIIKKKGIKGDKGTVIKTSNRKAIYQINGNMTPSEIIYENDLVDFWIVQGCVLYTTLNSAGIWNLICCHLDGTRLWTIELLSNLSCAPIGIGAGCYLLCTNAVYLKAQSAMAKQEIIVSNDGKICDTKLSNEYAHPLQDAYVNNKTIWCLRSGTTNKVDSKSHCTICEWEIECFDNPV